MDYIYKNFLEVKDHILEADILLFRGKSPFSFLLRMTGRTRYTHVAIASWKYTQEKNGKCKKDILECIEFKEGIGARTTNLSVQLKKYSGRLDVFRLSNKIQLFDANHLNGYWIELDRIKVTNKLRTAAGLKYDWTQLCKVGLTHIPLLRFIFKPNINDYYYDNVYDICSSAISAAIRDGYSDPVKFLADQYTEPSDLARSSMLSYLFTLTL